MQYIYVRLSLLFWCFLFSINHQGYVAVRSLLFAVAVVSDRKLLYSPCLPHATVLSFLLLLACLKDTGHKLHPWSSVKFPNIRRDCGRQVVKDTPQPPEKVSRSKCPDSRQGTPTSPFYPGISYVVGGRVVKCMHSLLWRMNCCRLKDKIAFKLIARI